MSYCKHQWQDRTAVLREVFQNDTERRTHEFFVCTKCLRINEQAAVAADATVAAPLSADEARRRSEAA